MFRITKPIKTKSGYKLPYLDNFDNIFEFIEVLGSGSFSTVSLYKLKSTSELYALKETRISASSPDSLFIDSLSEIENCNIINKITSCTPKCYGRFCYKRGNIFIYAVITEYIRGVTIDRYKNINVIKLVNWLIMMIDTMQKNNITHGDIKCDNILYNEEYDKFYLIDFGFSIREGSFSYKDNTVRGTPYYLSPCLVDLVTSKKVDKQILFNSHKIGDIWAAGIVIYYITHSDFPYKENNNCKILFELIKDSEIKIEQGDEISKKFMLKTLSRDESININSLVEDFL